MAIIVKNVKITPTNNKPVVERSYQIPILASGEVDLGEDYLDLGCQGDHNITKLEFDVSKLNSVDLVGNNNLLANYIPVLVFSGKNKNGDLTNISCTGVNNDTSKTSTFYIPEDVTTMSKDYSIVYTLQEVNEDKGNVNIDNVTEGNIKQKEVFVSNVFKGKVRSSIYADLDAAITVKDKDGQIVEFTTGLLPRLVGKRTEEISTSAGIYKKRIALTWPDGKGNILINNKEQDALPDEDKILGNKYDVFMTYITIDHPFYHEQSTGIKDNEIFVIFISDDKDGQDYAVITTAVISYIDNSNGLAAVWVPSEVTVSDRKKWKVGFVGLTEHNNESGYWNASYSPTANFTLNQNFLVREEAPGEDDIKGQSAEVSLMTSDGEKLQGKENGSVYTLTVYDARNTTYPLGMSGEDVKNRLKKVDILDTLNADSTTHGSIQNSISTEIDTHDRSTSAHSGLVRAGTSDAKEYEAYKGKNTVEGIVKVIRGEIDAKVTSIGAMSEDDIKEAITNAINSHNGSTDEVHTFLVDKITNTKTELTTEINAVKDKETDLEANLASLQEKFDKLDKTYVNESELQEKLNNDVLGFDPNNTKENEKYGSYTIKTLKDESDTRLSQTNADIAKIKVKAEEARTTANEANQTAANAYDAVTTIIQNKAEKTEVQLLNTKLDTEIAKNTREHEAINKKINDDLAAAKIEIDGKITQAVEDAKYNLGLVDNQLQGQIDTVKERIQNLGSNEATINNRLSAAETDISELNVKINGLDNTYATDAALESVKSDLEALETKESQDITNLTNTINALKGSDVAEDVTISSIDSKVNTLTSDLETYKGEVNSSIANINTSIGELTSADEQINTSLDSKLSKTTQIQSFGNVFNSEAEWEAFKESAEATTLYFVLEEE